MISLKAILFPFLLLLSLLLKTQSIEAQDSTHCKLDRDYFRHLAIDYPKLITSPSRWDNKEAIAASTVMASTLTLFYFDSQISTYFKNHQNKTMDQWNTYFFDPLGKMYYTIPIVGAIYLQGVFFKNDKSKAVAFDFVQASLYSGITITVIKHLTHRVRPFQSPQMDAHIWDGPITDDFSHTSFASGHTIMIFTFASVLGSHYKDHLWVPITLYSLASLEAFSRVYSQNHWTSDVVVGAALGFAIGKFVVNQDRCKLKAIPVYGTLFKGIQFSYPL